MRKQMSGRVGDTLWVGLVSGYVLAVSTMLPQRALIIIMKPYNQMV